ncbi:hypothetical protein [Candidatus Tisiphia endosymbiont of Temnostethus pusillus]|uniref:hypothetical protein n=1 Tax=Candidatus Tisiphia endosymbiont of Temnostethus pusillus TaxID=3139335 RepID=UPI0035C92A79
MRTIGYAGDSTDGEDYEEDPAELPPKGLKSRRKDLIEKLNKYRDFEYQYNSSKYQDFNYGNSCVLKEMGQQILQSQKVRGEYKVIKQKLFISQLTQQEKDSLEKLGKLIGSSYNIIVSDYEAHGEILSRKASDFFKINQQKIEESCGQDPHYKNLNKSGNKANFYIKHEVKDKINDIYKLNKKIELYAQNQRQTIEPTFTETQKNDAGLFLAQIKAIKKLDKLLGINCVYDYKFGTKKHITGSSISKKTTQKDETLEIHTLGAFSDYMTDEGAYDAIQKRLQRFIDERYIDKSKLSKFFKSSLRGKEYGDVILNNELRDELTNQLQTLVKLMFGVEVKRNAATLLTNAMFFDLVDANMYKIGDILDKMPMVMQGAVSASTTIDKEMRDKTEVKKTSEYDCRAKFEPSKARDLANRDDKILQDWLKWKLQSDIDAAVEDLGGNDSIGTLSNRFKDLNISIGRGRGKIMDKLPIPIRPGNNEFEEGKIQWNQNESKIKSEVSKVQKVKAKVFHDLINDWYGIKLPHLDKLDLIIELKASAEPRDFYEDQDYSDLKASSADTEKVGPELDSYEQKHIESNLIDMFVQLLGVEEIGVMS